MNTIPDRLCRAVASLRRPAVALLALLVAGCAGLEAPRGDSVAYHCRADSALRYRGASDPRSRVTRPAPKHGSCRHQ